MGPRGIYRIIKSFMLPGRGGFIKIYEIQKSKLGSLLV